MDDPHGIMRFFSKHSGDPDAYLFKGAARMQREYFRAREELQNSRCPQCQLGQLIRSYAHEVAQRMGVESPLPPP